MALDYSIPLQFRPREVDPVQSIAQMLSLRDMADAAKMRQFQFQQAQKEAERAEGFRKAIATGDREAALAADPTAFANLEAKALDARTKRLSANKTEFDLEQARRQARIAKLTDVGNFLRPLAENGNQDLYDQAKLQVVERGYMTADEAAQLPTMFNPGFVKRISQTVMSEREAEELAWKRADEAAKAVKRPFEQRQVVAGAQKAETDAQQAAAEAAERQANAAKGLGAITDAQLLQRDVSVSEAELAQRAAQGDKSAEAALARLGTLRAAGRTNVNVGALPPSLPPVVKSMEEIPEQFRSLAQAVREGRQPLPRIRSGENGRVYAQIERWVNQVDPKWSGNRARVYQEFNTGGSTTGKLITAANTLIGHLGTLDELAKAAKNGDVRAMNAAVNFLRKELQGDPRITNIESAAKAVADEAAKLYSGGGQSAQADREEFAKSMNAVVQSPAQARGVIQTQVKLLASRVKGLRRPWDEEMPEELRARKFLQDEPRAVLLKFGIDPDEVEFGKSSKAVQKRSLDQIFGR